MGTVKGQLGVCGEKPVSWEGTWRLEQAREKERKGWLRERSVRVGDDGLEGTRGVSLLPLFSAQSCSLFSVLCSLPRAGASWGTEVPVRPLTCKGNQSNAAAPVREEKWGAGGEPAAQLLGSLTCC